MHEIMNNTDQSGSTVAMVNVYCIVLEYCNSSQGEYGKSCRIEKNDWFDEEFPEAIETGIKKKCPTKKGQTLQKNIVAQIACL